MQRHARLALLSDISEASQRALLRALQLGRLAYAFVIVSSDLAEVTRCYSKGSHHLDDMLDLDII